jgi:RNA polymerase sigma-70 factor, ECF subfamily
VQTNPASDAPQLEALRAGRDGALDVLVARWQRPLFAFAWRHVHQHADAEDLVIETFVRLHEQRTRLRRDTNLSAWLFTTLANLCHNHHRWRRRHPEFGLDGPTVDGEANAVAASLPSMADPADLALENTEAAAAVATAISHLSPPQRTVLLLHHYEHLSYREIAAIVGCAERGIETRLHRARRQLRDELAPLLREPAPHDVRGPA